MIAPYVDKRMEQWALWAIGRMYGGSSTSCMTGLIDIFKGEFIRSTAGGRIPINPDAEEIERIVTRRLPKQHQDVIIECYLRHGHISQKCRRLGISRPTYYSRLRLAMFRIHCELTPDMKSKAPDYKGKSHNCAV